MASTDLPVNNKQKGRKDWSNHPRFAAAVDEWNNNRPMGNKNKLMSMAAFCTLRDIPYRSFLRHCKSDATKEAEKKQRRDCYATTADKAKEASKKKKRENEAKRRATMSDDMKEARKKQNREYDAKRRATMSDDTKQATNKQKREHSTKRRAASKLSDEASRVNFSNLTEEVLSAVAMEPGDGVKLHFKITSTVPRPMLVSTIC